MIKVSYSDNCVLYGSVTDFHYWCVCSTNMPPSKIFINSDFIVVLVAVALLTNVRQVSGSCGFCNINLSCSDESFGCVIVKWISTDTC